MQRLQELEAANLPPDFFKEERERREAEQERRALQEQTDEAVMAAKQAELKAHEAEVRQAAGVRRQPSVGRETQLARRAAKVKARNRARRKLVKR